MLLLTILSSFAAAQKLGKTHFYVQEGKSRCFIEETSEGVPLTVTYENFQNPGIPCAVEFHDPHGKIVFSREVTDTNPSGKVAYMPRIPGEYEICAVCQGSRWFGSSQLKWSLSVDVGDVELAITDVAKATDTLRLIEQARSIKQRLTSITAGTDYTLVEQEKILDEVQKANKSVMWIAICQILAIILSVIASARHISRFFRAQKIF